MDAVDVDAVDVDAVDVDAVDVDAVDVDAVDVAPGGAMMGSRWDQEGQGARVSVKDLFITLLVVELWSAASGSVCISADSK